MTLPSAPRVLDRYLTSKAKQRFDSNKKLIKDMVALVPKIENANEPARKKFDSGYDKLFASGEAAAKCAERLLKQHGDTADEDVITWLESCLQRWRANKVHHHTARGTRERLNQAHNTYSYSQELDAVIKDFDKLLKEPQTALDNSWRN